MKVRPIEYNGYLAKVKPPAMPVSFVRDEALMRISLNLTLILSLLS